MPLTDSVKVANPFLVSPFSNRSESFFNRSESRNPPLLLELGRRESKTSEISGLNTSVIIDIIPLSQAKPIKIQRKQQSR